MRAELELDQRAPPEGGSFVGCAAATGKRLRRSRGFVEWILNARADGSGADIMAFDLEAQLAAHDGV